MREPKTLYDYWRTRAETLPEKRLFGDDLRWVTSLESLAISEHIAARLRFCGILKGDLVALRADRRLLVVHMLIALRTIGAVVALTDPRYEPNAFLANRPLPRPVFAVIEPTGDSTFTVTTAGKTTAFDLFAMPPTRLIPTPCDTESPAFWLFPDEADETAEPVLYSETDLFALLERSYAANDVVMSTLPFHRLPALVLLCGTALIGYSLYLPLVTDAPSLLRAVEMKRVTCLCAAPAQFNAMGQQAEGYDLTSLRSGCIDPDPLCAESRTDDWDALGVPLTVFSV